MNETRHSPSIIIASLPRLEGVRGGELVARARVPLDEVLVPVVVDEALLPAEQLRPRRVLAERRLAARVEPLAVHGRLIGAGRVLVEAEERVVADDLQRAVRVLRRQLLRVRRQLRERLRRALQPGRLEHRLVVVEAVDVGEQRQRAALALVLGVVHRRRREDARLDPVLLHVRSQVDPAAGRTVDADVRRRERADDVGRVAAAERGDDLVVVDAADDLDLDGRVLAVVLGRDLLELAQLAGAPARPTPSASSWRTWTAGASTLAEAVVPSTSEASRMTAVAARFI